MGKRVAGKIAVVVGAGQTPGETIGNGAAISLLLAREGATVLCVDRAGERADKTVAVIAADELARPTSPRRPTARASSPRRARVTAGSTS